MNKLLIILLILPSISLSQNTYKSLASEYYYLNYEGQSKIEWIERDIIISEETIIVKSKGKQATDIQTWKIQNIEKNIDTESANTVYYVHLASGEEYEYPASFTVHFDTNEKVETITFEIPPNSQIKLDKLAPVNVKFLID